MREPIGAQHQFHDAEFVKGWAERFVPTPERLALFDAILSELRSRLKAPACVVELGIGPGYLADHLLGGLPGILYYGVDFSVPMLQIARHRLQPHEGWISYVQADLLKDEWWSDIPGPVDAVVSTWSLHDLGSLEHVGRVYECCAQLLRRGGVLLNGDFIKPDGAIHEYEPGRFEIEKHIALLRRAGFDRADCLLVLEEEIAAPTPAQNYACFRGLVR